MLETLILNPKNILMYTDFALPLCIIVALLIVIKSNNVSIKKYFDFKKKIKDVEKTNKNNERIIKKNGKEQKQNK